MTTIARSRPGHWSSQDFADSRFHTLDDGPRAALIASIEGQLEELREYVRMYPDMRNYVEHQREALRAQLRALRKPEEKQPVSAAAVCTWLALLPIAFVSIFKLAGVLLNH